MLDPNAGINLLLGRIAKVQSRNEFLDSPNSYRGWVSGTAQCLARIFGENDSIVEGFCNSSASNNQAIRQALDVQVEQIEAAIEILKAEAASPQKDARVVQVMKHEDSRKVFIVHGHDVTLKYEIAHTLQNAGLDVTILHEQANEGRTMLEKFADHAAEAGFAVVLLTADDVGRQDDCRIMAC